MDNKESENNIHKIPEIIEEKSFDLYQFLGMLLSIQSMFFKNKYLLWFGLYFVISSFFNRKKNSDYGSLVMIFTMIVISFYSIYYLKVPVTEQNDIQSNINETLIEDNIDEGVILDN